MHTKIYNKNRPEALMDEHRSERRYGERGGTIFGYSLGPTSLSLSFNGSWCYTWVSKIEYEKHPTLTDLYNARPGGY
jgi:hypothetical protein